MQIKLSKNLFKKKKKRTSSYITRLDFQWKKAFGYFCKPLIWSTPYSSSVLRTVFYDRFNDIHWMTFSGLVRGTFFWYRVKFERIGCSIFTFSRSIFNTTYTDIGSQTWNPRFKPCSVERISRNIYRRHCYACVAIRFWDSSGNTISIIIVHVPEKVCRASNNIYSNTQ